MSQVCGDLVFGTDTPIALAGVVVESLNGDSNLQFLAEAKNKKGSTMALVAGQRTGTISITGYLKAKLEGGQDRTPKINDRFTFQGLDCYVDKVTINQSNQDFQKVDLTAKFWEGVTGEACEI